MMDILSSEHFRKTLRKVLIITLAMMIDAAGVAFFVLPYHLIIGGVTGIGKIIAAYTPITVSFSVTLLEVLMLLLAFLLLGKSYGMSIILASLEYPLFLNLFERFTSLQHMTDDLLVASVFSGLMMGAAIGLVICVGSASGGTDVLTLILHKRCGLPLAPSMLVIESAVLLGQFSFSSPEEILLGLLTSMICTLVMNQVVTEFNGQAQLMIISTRSQDIRKDLLGRNIGITLLHSESGLLSKPMEVLISVVHTRQIDIIRRAVQAIDPEAFITVSTMRDVRGRGFTLEQRILPLMEPQKAPDFLSHT